MGFRKSTFSRIGNQRCCHIGIGGISRLNDGSFGALSRPFEADSRNEFLLKEN